MAGFGGWFGGHMPEEAQRPTALHMAEQLFRGVSAHGRGGHDPHLAGAPEAAVAVVPGLVLGEAVNHDGIVAAIYGRPRWEREALAARARRGFAHSVAEAWREHGAEFLDQLKGWFAVAVYDTASRSGVVAIDRSGIASLCYGRASDGAFVFGATTDAVRAYPGVHATIAPQGVFNYLFSFVVPSPTTIFGELRKLRPGEMVEIREDAADARFYWEMPYTTQRTGAMADFGPALLPTLEAGFRRTVEGASADEVGAFLSGGLDSSTVAGLMANHYGDGRTFTIAFKEPKYDESRYARIAAEHFGTVYHEYVPTPEDVLDLMPQLADAYDEPYGNTSAVPAYCCARMAREHGVSVMLAGDGGDEIFAGNERYAMMQRIERYALIPRPLRKILLEPLLKLPGVGKLPVLSRAARWSRRYAIPMPERIYSYGFAAAKRAPDIFTSDAMAAIDLDQPTAILRETYERPRDADMLQRMMHLDLKATLADNDLRKVNRMCALAGVEVRYPFLDDGVMAYAATIPSKLLLPGTRLRKFFKDATRDFLPREILVKQKHGFGLPFEVWVKQHRGLQDMVRDLVTAAAGRGFFNRAFLDSVVASTARPERTALDSVAWDIAMLEMWMRAHMDPKA